MATRITTKAPGLKKILDAFGKKGFKAESDRIQKAQAQELADARNLLRTDIIRDRDASAAGVLLTTLGGQLRPITLEDLENFSANIKKLGKRFKGGITARGVIDFSLQVDRDRANQQIRTAVAVRAQAGLIHFITNAGPDSKDVRHHVHVEFPAFKAYSASPVDPKKLAKSMLEGPIKFSCSCSRARYWYDYVQTIGGFKAGEQQRNFPKIRNPMLAGVACKHALRVMVAIRNDATVRMQAAKMIAAAQSNDTKAQTVTAAEARARAEAQLRQAKGLKAKAETTKEREARLNMSPARRAKVATMKAAEAEARKRAAATQQASDQIIAAALVNLKNMGLTPAQMKAAVAKFMKAAV